MKQKLILLTVLLTALSAFSAEYFVDASRPDDTGAATNWATAKKTIQAAVNLTKSNDTVWVTNGVYDTGGKVTPGYSLTNRVCITNAITVRSVNGPEVTTIKGAASSNGGNGTNSVRGVFMANGCELVGFTITNGYTKITGNLASERSGGGIWLTTNCVVSNCTVIGNLANNAGGGVYLFRGGTLNNCVIAENLVAGGSGAGINGTRGASGTDGTGNDGFGGGVYLYYGGMLNHCTLSGNRVDGGLGSAGDGGSYSYSGYGGNGGTGYGGNAFGGGAYLEGGSLNNCLLNGNIAVGGTGYGGDGGSGDNYGRGGSGGFGRGGSSFGGSVYLIGGTLNNCLLCGNQTSGGRGWGGDGGDAGYFGSGGVGGAGSGGSSYGGGLYLADGTVGNCTVSKNTASGGIGTCGYGGFGGSSGGSPHGAITDGVISGIGVYLIGGVLNNSIVWGNAESSLGKDICNSGGINWFVCASDGVTYGINGNITNAPLFVDAANGDFRLQSNSPCINWGNNSYVTNATDLAGNSRIVEGVVDMGAYEYQGIVGLADSDADGIADDWERQHGGNQSPAATCSNGVNTLLQAYVAGLDPNDPQSKFTTTVSGQTLRWNATSGRVYAVYYSTNLLDGFQPLETNIPWTAGCFTDSVPDAGQRFYRIEVTKP